MTLGWVEVEHEARAPLMQQHAKREHINSGIGARRDSDVGDTKLGRACARQPKEGLEVAARGASGD